MLLSDDIVIKSFVTGTFLHGAASVAGTRLSEVNMASQVERWRLSGTLVGGA